MPEDPNELVDIVNPKLHPGDDPPTAITTRAAFAEVWKAKGFQIVGASSPGSAPKEGK